VIVIYDTTGSRHQAGIYAVAINRIIRNMVAGKMSEDDQLREVLGHTPLIELVGPLFGIGIAQIIWSLWWKGDGFPNHSKLLILLLHKTTGRSQ
jgi:acid phosphatase family membrane protein YuiD